MKIIKIVIVIAMSFGAGWFLRPQCGSNALPPATSSTDVGKKSDTKNLAAAKFNSENATSIVKNLQLMDAERKWLHSEAVYVHDYEVVLKFLSQNIKTGMDRNQVQNILLTNPAWVVGNTLYFSPSPIKMSSRPNGYHILGVLMDDSDRVVSWSWDKPDRY
jgi:hypothetical protein